MSASVAVIEILSDEEDSNNAVIAVARLPRHRAPPGMDRASWKLIQQLQAAEGAANNDDDVQVVSSPMKKPASKEQQSLELARKLQAQEDTRRRRQQKRQQEQEKLGFTLAESIHKKFKQEDERVAKIHRPTPKQVFDDLKPCQQQAVSYVQGKAKAMHEKALPLLQARVEKLGLAGIDLTQCLDYIKDDATIIIHVKDSTLSVLVKDTHYRNLFETGTSGGGKSTVARQQWEKSMFGDCYNTAVPLDRPKYGCLNFTGDVTGVKSVQHYGKCFLILQQHIRHRTTFFNKDTGGFAANCTLATSEYYAHILNSYNDEELQAAIHVAGAGRNSGAPSPPGSVTYKEVQIHGPVCLATDIQALSVPGGEKSASKQLKKNVLAFQKMANCNVLWQEDLLNPEEDP